MAILILKNLYFHKILYSPIFIQSFGDLHYQETIGAKGIIPFFPIIKFNNFF